MMNFCLDFFRAKCDELEIFNRFRSKKYNIVNIYIFGKKRQFMMNLKKNVYLFNVNINFAFKIF